MSAWLWFFVCVEAKRPSQQLFSHVGTEPPLPGNNQYFGEVKCLAQGHNMAEVGFEPPTRFGPESFWPWVVSARVDSALGRFGPVWWVVSAYFFLTIRLVTEGQLNTLFG